MRVRLRSFTSTLSGAARASLLVSMVACGEVNDPGDVGAKQVESPPVATHSGPTTAMLEQASNAPQLEISSASFALVQGKPGAFEIRYHDPASDDPDGPWFLRITVPQETQLWDADGSPLARGDTLTVTVDVDPTKFLVGFEPHGTQFTGERPVTLSFKYDYAKMDGRDPAELRIWYQPMADAEWSLMPSEVDQKGSMVWMPLHHFSNYAMAF